MYHRGKPTCCDVNERVGYFEYVKAFRIPSTMNQIEITHRLMQRKFQRLPNVAKVVVGFSLLLCITFYGLLFFAVFSNPLKRDGFVELEKCPACYGTSKCSRFKNGIASLSSWTHLPLLSFLNVKNVYLGFEGDQKVILKRLGHSAELSSIDDELCRKASRPIGCNVADAIRRTATISGTRWLTTYSTNMSDLTACPTDRLMERIMDKYQEKVDAIQLSGVEKMYLLTTLMVNPEPILLQVCVS